MFVIVLRLVWHIGLLVGLLKLVNHLDASQFSCAKLCAYGIIVYLCAQNQNRKQHINQNKKILL